MAITASPVASSSGAAPSEPSVAATHLYADASCSSSVTRALLTVVLPPSPPPAPPVPPVPPVPPAPRPGKPPVPAVPPGAPPGALPPALPRPNWPACPVPGNPPWPPGPPGPRLPEGRRADTHQGADAGRQGDHVVRVDDAVHIAEHQARHQHPAAPQQRRGPGPVGADGPARHPHHGGQRDQRRRQQPADLPAELGVEQPQEPGLAAQPGSLPTAPPIPGADGPGLAAGQPAQADRKSTRLNSSHTSISYA